MSYFLGIDTSNYTTSVAIYCDETNKVMMRKKLLEVKNNACGLRQSDAVFLHVKQMSNIVFELFSEFNDKISAVGVSAFPRRVEGSYMPCFLVGDMLASCIASILKIPKYEFSHQEGHIVSALYSADILTNNIENFYAFHVSGGTTEALLVAMHENNIDIELLAKTLDLNAGQLVDRVGNMLGLGFPAGKDLEILAQNCMEEFKHKIKLKDMDCCLSGLENKCKDMLDKNQPKEYIAKYCITYIGEVIHKMTMELLKKDKLPVVYAGGVMSNKIIKQNLKCDVETYFATPEFSTDNSAGIAILASKNYKKVEVIIESSNIS